MEKKYSDIDLAGIMDNPQNYTEDSVREFFSDQENRVEYMAVLRAKQAMKRSETPAPDVETAWEQFYAQNMKPSNVSEKPHNAPYRHFIGYAFAALCGAAAMLLAILFLWHPKDKDVSNSNSELLTVLEYDDRPQNLIMLINGEQEKTLQPRDSISFYAAKTDGSTSLARPAKEEPGFRTLKTPRGMELKIILPDSSEVWLNAESSLEFPTAFTDSRHVELVGEAYFKVARDEQRPFTVSTDKINVKVLGTEFNFRNYDTEQTQVALVSGRVEVLRAGADDASEHIVLQPGEAANVDEDGRISVNPVNTYAVNQWTKGFFYFHDKTLEAALQEIGRWYNKSVIFENTEKLNEKIHFSALRGETLQQTLDKLNRLMNTHIMSVGNKIIVR